jgi:hypothetical protein
MPSFEAAAKSDAVREVRLDDWGKAVLEELLLQAALQVSEQKPTADSVKVSLVFELTPMPETGCIAISTPGAVERAIITQLPLHA